MSRPPGRARRRPESSCRWGALAAMRGHDDGAAHPCAGEAAISAATCGRRSRISRRHRQVDRRGRGRNVDGPRRRRESVSVTEKEAVSQKIVDSSRRSTALGTALAGESPGRERKVRIRSWRTPRRRSRCVSAPCPRPDRRHRTSRICFLAGCSDSTRVTNPGACCPESWEASVSCSRSRRSRCCPSTRPASS